MRSLVFLALLSVFAIVNSDPSFPKDFIWGSATASYQVEGAYNEDGRGPTIWDTFSHAGKCAHNDTGDVADDHYHRVDEDIALMTKMGVGWYRMSIAWSRIFPTGVAPANPAGIAHYRKELESLRAQGLKPLVTLYHWDLPQALEDIGGWRNPSIQAAYVQYATTAFASFGDLVSMWATFNEPWCTSWLGHGNGQQAPGRCSDRTICAEGDSWTEPYIVAHNIILSHAAAVKVYREQFQGSQGGKIGIVLNCDWPEPYSVADEEANVRQLQFSLGWFAYPIFYGDYPPLMKQYAGSRLPTFTPEQSALVKGSHDYFGLNHYSSYYVQNLDNPGNAQGWAFDVHTGSTRYDQHNTPIGKEADSSWLWVVPWGIRKMLNHVSQTYGQPDIVVTENGVDVPNESSLPLNEALNDDFRVDFYRDYLTEASKALNEDGVKLKGYFAWSLMDNFEWSDGYSKRFGLHYVDYKDNQRRYPKKSSKFFAEFIKNYTKTN